MANAVVSMRRGGWPGVGGGAATENAGGIRGETWKAGFFLERTQVLRLW